LFLYEAQRRAIRSDVLGFKWMHFLCDSLKRQKERYQMAV